MACKFSVGKNSSVIIKKKREMMWASPTQLSDGRKATTSWFHHDPIHSFF
jgi:hypothetical protein